MFRFQSSMSNSEKEITLENVLEEILNLKSELKNSLAAIDAKIALRLETLDRRNRELTEENSTLKESIERLERKNNKNNLIVFGAKVDQEKPLTASVCDLINSHLDLNITESDIGDAYELGKAENRPIKIEFLSFQKKRLILENKKKLIGTDLFIRQDLTSKQREEQSTLRAYMKHFKETTSDECHIRGNRLLIGKTSFTISQLQSLESVERRENKSAPSTPTTPIVVDKEVQQTPSLKENNKLIHHLEQ